jgi:dihydroneopterin aldolase
MMDIIYLNDLRIDTIIGIYDWERRVKQTISLDLEMASDIRKAAASDHIPQLQGRGQTPDQLCRGK